jgi:hypothetical protein
MRQQEVSKRRDELIKTSAEKNAAIRGMVGTVVKRYDDSVKPVPYERHIEEWKLDMKRQKKMVKATD